MELVGHARHIDPPTNTLALSFLPKTRSLIRRYCHLGQTKKQQNGTKRINKGVLGVNYAHENERKRQRGRAEQEGKQEGEGGVGEGR